MSRIRQDIKYKDEANKLYHLYTVAKRKGDCELMYIIHRELDNLRYKYSKGEL